MTTPRHRITWMSSGWLALTLCAGAADWGQFRGPGGSGVSAETNLPVRLEARQAPAWKIGLPGRGLSSPIVVGDRVFVTCSSGPRQARLHVICFSATTGAKLWERQFWATGRTMCQEKTCVAAPTPASDGRRVFAIFSSNDLVALDLEGNLLWLRGLTLDYPNASNSLGMSSSLLVVDGTLIVQIENDSQSLALGIDLDAGTNRWRMDRPKMANWTSPIVSPAPGAPGDLAVLQSGRGLTAVEPATGKVVWDYTDGASTIPSSVCAGGVVYAASHGLTALRAEAGQAKPAQVWRAAQLRPGTASPVVVGDRVYVLNDAGVLNCGDVADGRRVWQLRLKGPFSSSPVAASHYLYAVNETGLIQVVDLSKPEGEVVGEFNFEAVILCTPALAGGAIYVRSDRNLWKLASP